MIERVIGSLSPKIGNLPYLTGVGLSNLGINGTFPNSLQKCTRLTYLDLSYNYITGNVPAWVKSIKTLNILYLNENELSGKPPVPSKNQTFRLEGNKFSGVTNAV